MVSSLFCTNRVCQCSSLEYVGSDVGIIDAEGNLMQCCPIGEAWSEGEGMELVGKVGEGREVRLAGQIRREPNDGLRRERTTRD